MTRFWVPAAFGAALATSAYAQQTPEQKAVSALGALDTANDAIRSSIAAWANDQAQKAQAQKTADEATAKYWVEYVKGIDELVKKQGAGEASK